MGNTPQVEETKEKELIMEQMESNSVKFADIPLKYRRDFQVVQLAVNLDPFSIFLLEDSLITEELAFNSLIASSCNNDLFKRLPDSFKQNREFVKKLLPHKPSILFQCLHEFKKDKELIKIAMIGDKEIYKNIPHELITEEFLLELFPLNPIIYEKLSEKERLKPDLAFLYMSNTYNINFVPKSLLKDSEFLVKCLIKIPSLVLKIPCDKKIFSDENLFYLISKNPEICQIIKIHLNHWKYSKKEPDWQNIFDWGEKIFKNQEIMIKLALNRSEFMKYFEFEFKDREMALKIIQHDGWGFQYLSQEFKNDPEIAFEAIYSCPSSLLSIPQQFKEDDQFVTKAIQQNGLLIQFCSNDVKNNYKLVELAMQQNKKSFHHISKPLQSNKYLILIKEVRHFLLNFHRDSI
jgi:hypothetical protein